MRTFKKCGFYDTVYVSRMSNLIIGEGGAGLCTYWNNIKIVFFGNS